MGLLHSRSGVTRGLRTRRHAVCGAHGRACAGASFCLFDVPLDADPGFFRQVATTRFGGRQVGRLHQVVRDRIAQPDRTDARTDRVEQSDVGHRRSLGAESAGQLGRDDPAEGPAQQDVRRGQAELVESVMVMIDPRADPAHDRVLGHGRWRERVHRDAPCDSSHGVSDRSFEMRRVSEHDWNCVAHSQQSSRARDDDISSTMVRSTNSGAPSKISAIVARAAPSPCLAAGGSASRSRPSLLLALEDDHEEDPGSDPPGPASPSSAPGPNQVVRPPATPRSTSPVRLPCPASDRAVMS